MRRRMPTCVTRCPWVNASMGRSAGLFLRAPEPAYVRFFVRIDALVASECPPFRRRPCTFSVFLLHERRQFLCAKVWYPVYSCSGRDALLVAEKSAFRKRIYLALIERRLLQGAAALDFKSAFEQKAADALGLPVPRVVIPIGVSQPEVVSNDLVTAFRKKYRLDGRFTLLSLSRRDPIKGLELVIEALAKLRVQGHFRLLIAGSGLGVQENSSRFGRCSGVAIGR